MSDTISLPKDSFDDVFGARQRVLVVTAHPDDNEVVCGGLVARLTATGKEVRVVVTTNGDKGSRDQSIEPAELARIRKAEQLAAAKVLGVPESECFILDIPDGELEASVENIGKVVWHIREFKPDIVITHCPDEVINTFSEKDDVRWVNHRDHRHTGLITTDALYPYSRDRAFFPEQLKNGLEPHEVTAILYSDAYEHSRRVYFDITDFAGPKRAALAVCPSQIESNHVDEYVEENKIGDRYYECLRYYQGLA
jgi:LmbE family N-acetylglucosaminyl deacetylase